MKSEKTDSKNDLNTEEIIAKHEKRKLLHYFKRTVQHIHRVQRNMLLLVTEYHEYLELSEEDRRELMHNVMKHDQSKFSKEQFKGYVEMTEYYFQRNEMGNKSYRYPSPEVEALTVGAWVHHYKTENHHPERFLESLGSKALIWGKYSKLEAIETVCDLQAMAQEFDEGTCRKYFEDVWKKKHAFHIPDDYNWMEVQAWMSTAIKCFEHHAASFCKGSPVVGDLIAATQYLLKDSIVGNAAKKRVEKALAPFDMGRIDG